MSDVFEEGAPFYFATRQPPSATAMDDDIYLTVTAGVPTHPDQVELITSSYQSISPSMRSRN